MKKTFHNFWLLKPENNFHKFMNSQKKDVLKMIADKKELSDDVVKKLESAIREFKSINK